MYRSEFTTIGDQGINIDQDLMKSIGVRSGNQCWGMLIDGRRQADKLLPLHLNIEESNHNPASQSPHLMVSPVHHDLWPSSARVAVIISDRPGALAALLGVIASRANIQLYELAPIGYKHSEVRMIINFPKFSIWARKEVVKLQENLAHLYGDASKLEEMDTKRVSVFKKIGAMMNALLSGLVAEILLSDILSLPDNPILSPRFMQYSTSPWFTSYEEISRTRKLLDELFYTCDVDNDSEAARKEASQIFSSLDAELSNRNNPPYQTVGNDSWFARTCGSGAIKNEESESEYLTKHIYWRERFFARTWRDSWTSTIRTSPLSHLAYAKVWGYRNLAMPLVYRVDENKKSLISCSDRKGNSIGVAPLVVAIQEADDHVNQYEKNGISVAAQPRPPEYAHAVVDSDGLWLRLRFLQEGFAYAYGVRVQIEFEVATKSKDAASVHTQGILAAVCTAIANHKGDIRMAYNEIKPSATEAKNISITLFCTISSTDRASVIAQGGEFREDLRRDWKKVVESAIENQKSKIDATIVNLNVEASEWQEDG